MSIFLTYWKEILSGLAVMIAVYSYVTYIRSIFTGKTEPHVFSWGIWTITTGIAFFAQVAGGGGWGAAQGGVTFLVCFFVVFLAIRYGKINKLTHLDWSSLFFSGVAIALWLYTKNPLYASIFATLADAIGYIPTFRKVWNKPESEPSGYYLLMNLKHGLSLMALSQYSWTTMIFSGVIIVINFVLVIIQILRKK